MKPSVSALRNVAPIDVETLSLKYLPRDDRLALICRGGQRTRVLLMTRRSVFAILKALGDLVRREQGDKRLIAAGAETGWLEMKHQRAVAQVRAVQAMYPENTGHRGRGLSPDEGVLVLKISCVGRSSRRWLVLHDGRGESTRVPLTSSQLHWFIERLGHYCRQAGWNEPAPLPPWMATPNYGPGPGRVAVH